jgi:hypothetical protein
MVPPCDPEMLSAEKLSKCGVDPIGGLLLWVVPGRHYHVWLDSRRLLGPGRT